MCFFLAASLISMQKPQSENTTKITKGCTKEEKPLRQNQSPQTAHARCYDPALSRMNETLQEDPQTPKTRNSALLATVPLEPKKSTSSSFADSLLSMIHPKVFQTSHAQAFQENSAPRSASNFLRMER